MGFGAKLLTKAAGAYALYLCAVDIGRFGKAFKNKKPQSEIAKNFPDMYINSQRINLSETLLPTVVSNAKNGWFNIYLQDSILPFWHGITGYAQGICTGITHNILPICLGIGAVASKRFGKYCAIGLALGAAKSFLYNVCGVGQYKKL